MTHSHEVLENKGQVDSAEITESAENLLSRYANTGV